MLPVVALVGRPNVGKSTLFNALTRSRDAIVADYEGLTRDRRYGVVEDDRDPERQPYMLVDTGGLISDADGIDALTAQQARTAIAESDLVLLLVDGKAGLTPEDEAIAAELRSTSKQVMLLVNKTDGVDEQLAMSEFYQLGFEPILPLAAAHRRGLGQLSESIQECLPDHDQDLLGPSHEGVKVAIIGRPNVGKSTLVNRLLGEERVLAFDMPGTTRDTIEIPLERDGKQYVLIDTAGVRRRSKVDDAVEKFSVIKALQAIERADVVVVMMDATEGVVDQDSTLLGYVLDSARPLLIALNKWDGLDRDERDYAMATLDRKLTFVAYAERLTIAAKHGSGLGELMDAVDKAWECASQDISSSKLSNILNRAVEAHQPPMVQGRTAKLRYAHLGGHKPLRIVLHGSRTGTLPDAYKRYLANVFRHQLKLVGTPIRLDFRDGDNPFKGKKNKLTSRQLAKRKRLKRFTGKRK